MTHFERDNNHSEAKVDVKHINKLQNACQPQRLAHFVDTWSGLVFIIDIPIVIVIYLKLRRGFNWNFNNFIQRS